MEPNGPYRSCEDSIRRAPLASVAIAFFAGIIFKILPVGALMVAFVRVALFLVRPALLIFGIVKAVEIVQDRQRS
jgi:hypothetical protein